MKYSYEKKLGSVLSVIRGEYSVMSAVRHFGVSRTPLQRWIARYEEFGEDGLRIQKWTYSGDFKLSVLKYMRENHLSLSETAAKFGIGNECSVGNWERIYYEQGEAGLYCENRGKMKGQSHKPRRPKLKVQVEEDLIAENQRLRAEVAYLKKLRALVEERIARESGNAQKPSQD